MQALLDEEGKLLREVVATGGCLFSDDFFGFCTGAGNLNVNQTRAGVHEEVTRRLLKQVSHLPVPVPVSPISDWGCSVNACFIHSGFPLLLALQTKWGSNFFGLTN